MIEKYGFVAVPSTSIPAYTSLDVLPVSFAFGTVPAAYISLLSAVSIAIDSCSKSTCHLPVSITAKKVQCENMGALAGVSLRIENILLFNVKFVE